MTLQLRVELVNGKTRRIPLKDSDPQQVIEKMKQGRAPFSAEWLEADDGELIRTSAIVSAQVEPASSEPAFVVA